MALVLISQSPALAGEQKVPLDRTPKPVLEAVRARFKEARLKAASTEKENNRLVYEIALEHEGRNFEVTLTPSGEILAIEKQIGDRDLPESVAAALRERYEKSTYRSIEEVVEQGAGGERPAFYEVALATADGRILEVRVAGDGRILEEERKGGPHRARD